MRFNNKNVILPEPIIIFNELCFTANTAGSTIALSNYGGNAPDIKYSSDGVNWTQWDYSAITLTNVGDKAYMKGNNPNGFSKSSKIYSQFTMSGSISASGSVMSLIDEKGVTTVIPSDYCYFRMFSSCTSLTTAPTLPATTLTNYCYSYMFFSCTSLEMAPELPATRLRPYCYSYMFFGCKSLNYIKCLATYIDYFSLSMWAYSVASSGTFVKAAGKTYETGSSGIPSGWTVEEV